MMPRAWNNFGATMGYECEFVEQPPNELQSECPICLQILREPHLVSCCGYSFCAACIERVKRDDKPCPMCKVPSFASMANVGLRRTLHEYKVHCLHQCLGCEWVGKLGDLNSHLNSLYNREDRMKGCRFVPIKCLHCEEIFRRDKIATHQGKNCPKRPYSCEYCRYKSSFDDVTNKHRPKCWAFPIPCPNDGCTRSIPRRRVKRHVKDECPLMVTKCEFCHTGCDVALPRKDMADHMKAASVSHVSLLASENRQLGKRLQRQEESVTVLIREVQALKRFKHSETFHFFCN